MTTSKGERKAGEEGKGGGFGRANNRSSGKRVCQIAFIEPRENGLDSSLWSAMTQSI
jgi:hypothetical protein